MTGIELPQTVEAEWPAAIGLLITASSDLQAAEDAINRGEPRMKGAVVELADSGHRPSLAYGMTAI